MPIVAKSDLSTENAVHASYLLRSGNLNFLFSAPYSASISGGDASAAIPSFSASDCHSFAAKHGLAVRAVTIEVEDVSAAFSASVANGANLYLRRFSSTTASDSPRFNSTATSFSATSATPTRPENLTEILAYGSSLDSKPWRLIRRSRS
ncbi:hypothetical protein S83_070052 [Arachis hypogaea]|uniref:4-hydroxyphenylpyruvate dioxygenase n=1 Tax=Arachis hypogaea TaxID=3818 RepID=A0A444X252_ARAHY|nr:4-hydroxyphenylpyruvate dioxygenase [Arachis hypogaea]RYQ83750.1 hypothetical protein Ahy_B10g102567 [Arachis hypogaea]